MEYESVGGQCRIIVSAPFWLKSVVKISVFAVGFGSCPWCQAYARCLFCRGGVFRLSMLVRNWTVASVRKFLTSDDLLGEAVSGEGGARSPSSRTAGAAE